MTAGSSCLRASPVEVLKGKLSLLWPAGAEAAPWTQLYFCRVAGPCFLMLAPRDPDVTGMNLSIKHYSIAGPFW